MAMKKSIKCFAIMSLLNTMNKLGRCAFKPVSLAVLALTLSYNVANAQVKADTLWGEGRFKTKIENQGSPIPFVELKISYVSMETIIPDTTYTLTTDLNGSVDFNFPVFIDTLTTILERTETNFTVFPNPGNDLNVFFSENYNDNEIKSIKLYNIVGQLVMSETFYEDHVYLDLEKLAVVPYTFTITKGSNPPISGIYIKSDVASSGPAQRPNLPLPPADLPFKNTTFQDYAIVKIKHAHPGYIPDSVLMDIYPGDNGPLVVYISPPPPLTASQDIAGFVQDGNNSLERMANVAVVLEHLNTGELYLKYTESDGSFIFPDMPVQMGYAGERHHFAFHVGDDPTKYSFKNVEYTTPLYIESTWTASDTINDNFNVVLMDKDANTTAQHIRDQDRYDTNQETIQYYYESDVPTTRQTLYDSFFEQLEQDEDNVYDFQRSMIPLDNTGITIGDGTPNTTPHWGGIITPIGDTLTPADYAHTTMATSSYIVFVHEIKQGIGYRPCAWPDAQTVLEANPSAYTIEDKVIAEKVHRPYWNYVYQDSATWIPISNIAENINDKIQQALEQGNNKNNKLQEAIKLNQYNSNSTLNGVVFEYNYE